MENKIKFGLVGCGRIAQRHALHISKMGKLMAVCDIAGEKATELGKQYGAHCYTDLNDLLKQEKEIQVISICTPNGLHAQHSIACLDAGFHVLCEKPMAINVKDCKDMIKAAERNNKHLFIVKQNRYNPPVAAVKEYIDSGKLGKILSVQLSCFWNRNEAYYHKSWKGTRQLDGGTLFTQFSHFIDLLYWMIGDIKNVNSFTNNYIHKGIIEFEDAGVAIVEFYNGAIGTINYNVNSYKKNMEGSVTIFGEKGTIKIGGQYLNVLEYQSLQDFGFKDLPTGNPANNYGEYQGSMSNHDLVYKNLLNDLLNGTSVSTNAFEGLKTVEIIEKIYGGARDIGG